jgi:hypothetical protein
MTTLQVIQRVELSLKQGDHTSTICFDDTPSSDDTTYGDRMTALSLIAAYKEKHFPNQGSSYDSPIYPNVILIIADRISLTPDAHNYPTFTSPLGKAMYNLCRSKLVDLVRPNVIIVVTKSLSYWHQFDDYAKTKDKNEQWKIDAAQREAIIKDLHRKIFHDSHSFDWPIIFVENGGGSDVTAEYAQLPDGQLSHQNLFKAMCQLIENTADGKGGDILGVSILQLFAMPANLKLPYQLDIGSPVNLGFTPKGNVPVSFFFFDWITLTDSHRYSQNTSTLQ